jgi:hypothetical protein
MQSSFIFGGSDVLKKNDEKLLIQYFQTFDQKKQKGRLTL